jgi:hypothetical protein
LVLEKSFLEAAADVTHEPSIPPMVWSHQFCNLLCFLIVLLLCAAGAKNCCSI